MRVAGSPFQPARKAIISDGPSRHRHGQLLDGMIQRVEPGQDLFRRDIR